MPALSIGPQGLDCEYCNKLLRTFSCRSVTHVTAQMVQPFLLPLSSSTSRLLCNKIGIPIFDHFSSPFNSSQPQKMLFAITITSLLMISWYAGKNYIKFFLQTLNFPPAVSYSETIKFHTPGGWVTPRRLNVSAGRV